MLSMCDISNRVLRLCNASRYFFSSATKVDFINTQVFVFFPPSILLYNLQVYTHLCTYGSYVTDLIGGYACC